jgi:elongation factor G
MAFKIVHHPQKGVLTFLRIYSGTLKEGDSVYNVSLDKTEKVTRLYVAFADDFR